MKRFTPVLCSQFRRSVSCSANIANVRNDFTSHVIMTVSGSEPSSHIKDILNDPRVRFYDLVQVPEAYDVLKGCYRIDRDLTKGVVNDSLNFNSDDDINKNTKDVLQLLLQHPKTVPHMVTKICNTISNTYTAQSQKEEQVSKLFNDSLISHFVNNNIGELIFQAVKYTEHPRYTIRILLERYDDSYRLDKVQEHYISLAYLYTLSTSNSELRDYMIEQSVITRALNY